MKKLSKFWKNILFDEKSKIFLDRKGMALNEIWDVWIRVYSFFLLTLLLLNSNDPSWNIKLTFPILSALIVGNWILSYLAEKKDFFYLAEYIRLPLNMVLSFLACFLMKQHYENFWFPIGMVTLSSSVIGFIFLGLRLWVPVFLGTFPYLIFSLLTLPEFSLDHFSMILGTFGYFLFTSLLMHKTIIFVLKYVQSIEEEERGNLLTSQKSLEMMAKFSEVSPVIMIHLNKNGKILKANGEARIILGTEAPIESCYIFEICPELTRDELHEIRMSDSDFSLEITREERVYLLKFRPVKKLESIYVYGMNITLQKKLHLENLEFKKIVEQSHEGIIVTTLNGLITSWNQKAEEIFGYSFDEIEGKNEKLLVPTELLEEREKILERVCDNDKRPYPLETKRLNKDKKIIPVEWVVCGLRDDQGTIQNLSFIYQDLTEKNKMKAQLLHTEKLASIGELAAGVGHEINNPLAIAMGNLSRMQKELKKQNIQNPFFEKSLSRQKDAFDRIAFIVDGLLTYARVNNDIIELFNLHDLILKTFKLIAIVFKNDGVTVSLNLDAEKFFVTGNIGKFQQVIMNMLNNAKDATENVENREIKIETKNKDNKIIIAISDNGHGIDDAIKNEIFEKYFTTKPIGKGTGMGLGISISIIKAMEGEIDVQSEVGKGATFSIILPATDAAQEKNKKAS